VQALDERKTAILQAIVRGYVRDGETVGSKRIVSEGDVGVSAATVRNDMAALEEAGYIAQPHTSAGRVPTDKGYRFFVDTLGGTVPVSEEERAAIERVLVGSADLEQLLRRTSTVLSRLTRFAALVVAPSLDRSRLRHVELVQLGPTNVLAILIADTGRVDKRMLDLESPVATHDVQRASHAVNGAAAGLQVTEAPDAISGIAAGAPAEVRALVEAVGEAVRIGLVTTPSEQVFIGGTANIAAPDAFDRIEHVRKVYETFEEQVTLLEMLRETLSSGDPGVRIGGELPLVELAACSIVASSYEAAGGSAGSLGVLGPTRMDYPGTLAAVQAVASSLEQVLSAQAGDDARATPVTPADAADLN
jgi:heat-inducible transcriptional repressor